MPIGWASVQASDPSVCTGFMTITPDAEIAFRSGNECKVMVNVPAVNNIMGWVLKLLGFLISAFAARQGAPFWFDLLKKLVNLRSSTQPKKEEEAKG